MWDDYIPENQHPTHIYILISCLVDWCRSCSHALTDILIVAWRTTRLAMRINLAPICERVTHDMPRRPWSRERRRYCFVSRSRTSCRNFNQMLPMRCWWATLLYYGRRFQLLQWRLAPIWYPGCTLASIYSAHPGKNIYCGQIWSNAERLA
jgi:hypothetical protein